jgi:hypothetical protein
MADTLSTGTISRELRSDTDYFLYGETIPDNTTVNSNGLKIGKTQNALEIVGVAKTEMTVADTKAISFQIQESSDDGSSDSYVTIDTPYSLTSSGGDTIAAGTELFRYAVASDAELYVRVAFVSTETGESGTVDVYPVYQAR